MHPADTAGVTALVVALSILFPAAIAYNEFACYQSQAYGTQLGCILTALDQVLSTMNSL